MVHYASGCSIILFLGYYPSRVWSLLTHLMGDASWCGFYLLLWVHFQCSTFHHPHICGAIKLRENTAFVSTGISNGVTKAGTVFILVSGFGIYFNMWEVKFSSSHPRMEEAWDLYLAWKTSLFSNQSYKERQLHCFLWVNK